MSKTIIPLNKVANYNAVLLCFHWVGGNGFAFRKLATLLAPQGVLVYGVSLSLDGKNARPSSVQEAAQLVVRALQAMPNAEFNPLNRPLLLLGHSYGGIVAYEVSKLLPWPVQRLIVSCVRAPRDLVEHNRSHATQANHLKTNESLVDEIIRIDGLPAGVDPQFIWMGLQTIRDDFRAFETYTEITQSMSQAAPVPIVCISAENDRFVPSSETRGWKNAVAAEKNYVEHVLRGATHFYISDDKQLRSLQDIVLHTILF